MYFPKRIPKQKIFIIVMLSLQSILSEKINAQSYSLSTTGAIPDSSAMLDIISSNKGLLIPRVSLTSITDSSTIAHPAIALQVYNTNASMTSGGKGFWYWNGTQWIRSISSVGADSLVVGASSSSHLYNLQVEGTAGVTTSLTTPTIIGGSGTTTALTYKTTTGVGATGADHVFTVGNNGATEALRILNNGNVGIGTSSPQYLLSLSNENPAIYFSETDASTDNNNWAMYANTEKFVLSTRNDAHSHIAYILGITRGGNVGIGTTSPSAALQLKAGTATASTAPLKFTSGALLTTPETGAIEFLSDAYYGTITTGSARKTFAFLESPIFTGTPTLPTGTIATTQSLNDSTTKVATTAFVDRALAGVSGGSGWGLTGNSGTTDGTHFIGTTDNKPFNIKVNNQKAGRVDNSLGNAFWGYQAGNANTSGYWNTAVGEQALKSNTTGASNTALGNQALYTNTTGTYNTATGEFALKSNTTGPYNTATGQQALYYNTTGSSNTAMGMQALAVNTSGGYNAALGYGALNANTTGTHNTAVGYGAATSNTTGYYNTNVGHGANVSTGALNNATSLGAFAYVNATNKVRIGNSNVTVIEGQVAFTNVSDGRFKKNVSENDVKGLEFILRLRPVAYNVDTRQFEEFLVKKMPDSVKVKYFKNKDFTASTAIRHNGFIAQEVEQAADQIGYKFHGIHKPETDDDNYGLAYSEFVVPLVKAVQEQQQLIKDQQQLNKDQQQTIDKLTQRIQQLETRKQ